MADQHRISSELSRELSLFQITMMGLGMMIGAGVFLGTGKTIAYAGPGGVLLTFALNGLIAMFTAMSYAELSSAIPQAGGAYNFARISFGKSTSFIAGWVQWFASCMAGSLYAICFATYTVRFFTGFGIIHLSDFNESMLIKFIAVAIALLFIYINYRGASETGKVGAIMTLAQTLFLLLIGGMGIIVVFKDPSRLTNFRPFLNSNNGGWSNLLVTMGFTAVAFEGYEVIAQTGDESINPRRNIPKAMLYSVAIVTFTYIACAFAAIVAVKIGPGLIIDGKVVAPWQWIGSYGGQGFGAAVERLMPRWGGLLVMLAVIFASTSALNATIYSATRAAYAMGRDRMLPAGFSSISKHRKTPWVALLFTGIIVLIVAISLDTDQVAASASIMFLFLFFLVNICVIRIRYNMGDELHYGFLMPLFPLFPILAIISQAVLAVSLYKIVRTAWIIAPAWIIAGFLIYYFYSKSRAIGTKDEIYVLEEESAVHEGYKIMVAVSNPDNALALVRNTYALCEAKDAGVELLHMVPVPDQVPLSDADKYMLEGKEAIDETMLYLSPMFVFSSTIRYCRNIARGIISVIREKDINMLIMGWHGRSKSRGFTLGSTVDPVIERVPCNVVIFKDCSDQKYNRILVPVAGGPNSAFALEIAGIIADKNDGELVVFTVGLDSSYMSFDLDQFVMEQMNNISISEEKIKTKFMNSGNVVSSILKESKNKDMNYDLVVMGCTRESLISQFLKDSVPERVAKTCSKPFVMVKKSGGIKSWINRVLLK